MSLLERLRRLIASNVNALFDSLTDPGAAIDELISTMEAAAREAREQTKGALMEDKRALKLEQATNASIAEWTARAERAVTAGDDDLAREAISRRSELEEQLAEVVSARATAQGQLRELERGLRDLDAKISVVKSRKETLKAVMRARAVDDSAAARYDRIVTDVDVREAEVALGEELGDAAKNGKTRDVAERIAKLENNLDADARLAALKEKMKR